MEDERQHWAVSGYDTLAGLTPRSWYIAHLNRVSLESSSAMYIYNM